MKTLKYFSAFRNLEDELYQINIYGSSYNGAAVELVAGAEPLIITYEKEDIYSPIFGSTATLQFVGSDLLQGLFSAKPTDNYIEILKQGALFWQGYISQNIYSQDFSHETFEFEIEAVSAISVLKSLPFKGVEKSTTFKEYITYAISQIPQCTIKNIYVHDTLTLKTNHGKVIDLLSCHSSNWFDEENKPNSIYDVLENIALYLNMCIVIVQDSVYLYSTENNSGYFYYYTSYDNFDEAHEIVIPFNTIVNLIGDRYVGSDNAMSITESYSRITVENSLYEVDSIFPEISINSDLFLQDTGAWNYDDYKKATIRRYYGSNEFETWKYFKPMIGEGYYATTGGSDIPQNDLGAYICKVADYNTKAGTSSLDWEEIVNIQVQTSDKKQSIQHTHDGTIRKMFNRKVSSVKFTKTGFIASLDLAIRCSNGFPYDYSKVSTEKGVNGNCIMLPVKIKCSGKYYKNGAWQNEEHIEYLRCGDIGGSTEYTDTWYSVRDGNLISNNYNCPDLKGFIIDFRNELFDSDLDIEFYTPFLWVNWSNTLDDTPYYRNNEIGMYMIKDIEVKFQIPNERHYAQDIEDKDRLFEHVINQDFNGEEYNVELLLSTNLNDSVNRSTVLFKDDDYSTQFFKGFEFKGKTRIPEEIIAEKIGYQLKQPRKKLELSIKYDGVFNHYYEKYTDASYIPIRIIHDARYNKNNITLIELI